MENGKTLPERVIQDILELYGLETEFGEQKEYIHYYEKYGYNAKVVLSVLLNSGRRVVIKLVSIQGEDTLKNSEKIEKQSAFSEFLRQNGMNTPQYYTANGKYCNVYVYSNFPCNVTVEDWCGEEITEITPEISYKIGELLARMHLLSLENRCTIGCGTLFSAAYQNDVDVYEDFCRICENPHLNQEVIRQIKNHREEKLASLRSVWDRLPKAAVQGDISINNLVYGEEELTVFDYNNAGDEVLVSDLVMEGLLTAYEMDLPEGADPTCRELFFPALLKGYLAHRKLSEEEAETAWVIYTLYHALWFTRIVYNENSLEKLVERKEYEAADRLLVQMLADMTENDDGRFRESLTEN